MRFSVIEMRRYTQPPFSQGDLRFVLRAQHLRDLVVMVSGRSETDDPAPLPQPTRTHNHITLGFESRDETIGQHSQPLENVGCPNTDQQIHRRLEAEQSRNVVRPTFKPPSVGFQRVVVISIILRIDDIHPPHHERAGALDQFPPAVEHPRTFGPHQPFVPVGREIINLHRPYVDRHDAQRLDGIDAETHIPFTAFLSDARQLMPLPAGKFHMRKGHQAALLLFDRI